MSKPSRVCPLCEKSMDNLSCEECNVPSVELAMMEEGDETLSEGMIVAERYRIEKVLGRGAMGSVYEATQLSVDRRVAIKTLQKQLLNEYRLVQRFYREARAASQLDHPNVIQTYDFGIDPETNVPYIAMEYLDGYELTDLIDERHSLPEEETCAILGQVAAGLVEAHEKGVIHRDLKPQNIRVRVLSDGELQAKVLDFGIAKVVRGQEGGGTLTGTGMTVGTPPYMSPEQILGEGVDARADLYSLGCILHECLTGRLPFWADDRLSIVTMHLTGKRPELPDTLCDGNPPSDSLRELHRCLLARHKTERPAHARIVAKVLKKIAVGKPVDVKKMLLSATTHENATPLEKRRSDRNVALLSRRTDENLRPNAGQDESEEQVVASAPTIVAMTAPAGGSAESLLTGPEIPSDGSSIELTTLAPSDAPSKRWASGNGLVMLAAALTTVVAIVLVVALGGGGEEPSRDETDKVSVTEPTSDENKPATAKPNSENATTEGASKNKESTPDASPTIQVEVVTVPAGVAVESAGQYLGTTPLRVAFEEGITQRLLRLSKDGFETTTFPLKRSVKSPHQVTLRKKGGETKSATPVKERSRTRRPSSKPAATGPKSPPRSMKDAFKMMDKGMRDMNSKMEKLEKRSGFDSGKPKKPKKPSKTKPKKPAMDLW